MVERILTKDFSDGDYYALADYQAEEVLFDFGTEDYGEITLKMEELGDFVRFVDEVAKAVSVCPGKIV